MTAHTAGETRTTFVQTARSMTYGDGTLVLNDLAPATLFLAIGDDVVGYQTTGQFLDAWYGATDGPVTHSTAAVVALLAPDRTPGFDARLMLSLPRIHGTGLAYRVASIEGSLPATAGACVVFLDPRQDPVTPTGSTVPTRVERSSTGSVDPGAHAG